MYEITELWKLIINNYIFIITGNEKLPLHIMKANQATHPKYSVNGMVFSLAHYSLVDFYNFKNWVNEYTKEYVNNNMKVPT